MSDIQIQLVTPRDDLRNFVPTDDNVMNFFLMPNHPHNQGVTTPESQFQYPGLFQQTQNLFQQRFYNVVKYTNTDIVKSVAFHKPQPKDIVKNYIFYRPGFSANDEFYFCKNRVDYDCAVTKAKHFQKRKFEKMRISKYWPGKGPLDQVKGSTLTTEEQHKLNFHSYDEFKVSHQDRYTNPFNFRQFELQFGIERDTIVSRKNMTVKPFHYMEVQTQKNYFYKKNASMYDQIGFFRYNINNIKDETAYLVQQDLQEKYLKTRRKLMAAFKDIHKVYIHETDPLGNIDYQSERHPIKHDEHNPSVLKKDYADFKFRQNKKGQSSKNTFIQKEQKKKYQKEKK